jgi:hypothetical protein
MSSHCVTDKPNSLIRCSVFSSRKTLLRGWLTEIWVGQESSRSTTVKRAVRNSTRSRTVELNQKKLEVRSEACNLCNVVTETFGVLSLFGVMHYCNYSKINIVVINCNSAWRIPNKSHVKSGTYKIFVVVLLENTWQYVPDMPTIILHRFVNISWKPGSL